MSEDLMLNCWTQWKVLCSFSCFSMREAFGLLFVLHFRLPLNWQIDVFSSSSPLHCRVRSIVSFPSFDTFHFSFFTSNSIDESLFPKSSILFLEERSDIDCWTRVCVQWKWRSMIWINELNKRLFEDTFSDENQTNDNTDDFLVKIFSFLRLFDGETSRIFVCERVTFTLTTSSNFSFILSEWQTSQKSRSVLCRASRRKRCNRTRAMSKIFTRLRMRKLKSPSVDSDWE